MDHQPHALWSIWRMLSYSYRLFILMLCGASVYSLLSAIKILGVRVLRIPDDDIGTAQRQLAVLSNRWTNLRQAIGATFYLFGFVFFLNLQTAFDVLGLSSRPSLTVT